MHTFLIVDDNAEAREAINDILSMEADFRVVGAVRGGEEALEFLAVERPDIILMDVNMPGMNGFEATKAIRRRYPDSVIIMLSVSDNVQDFFEAIKQGAQGYLVKNLEPGVWLDYLRNVAEGHAPLSKELALRMMMEFTSKSPPSGPLRAATELTRRERGILQYVAEGLSNREIAEVLAISEYTVKNHLKNIMQKLHVKNRVQLARIAIQNPDTSP